ncbi:MAG: glycosyltransferase family 39 protein [Vicinamibacteria bacterium]|nr:glycosyltransferase family 39 protein [Vicinamibacteria bacterium]
MKRFAPEAGLLLLGALLLLPALGKAPIERAEIYFFDAARGMVESGDWLVPRYRGEAFYDKPALTYWSMAASQALFGVAEGPGRLPSVLAALATLLATVALGRSLLGLAAGRLAALMLVTTPALLAFGRTAMSDMLLTLWTTLAALLMVRLGGEPAKPSSLAWLGLGAALGLGFLTKGPIAVLLPGLFALAVLRRRGLRGVAWPSPGVAAGALGLFLLLALGWFVVLYLTYGSGPLEWFFLRENLERFKGATYDAGRPAWYYPPTYLAEALPWSPAVLLAVAALVRRRAPAAVGLLLEWVALALVPLSLSKGKIDYYLLPLYPPLALCAAWWLERADARANAFALRAWAGVLALALCGLALLPAPFDPRWLPAAWVQLGLRAVLVVGGAALLLLAWRPDPRRLTVTLASLASAASLLLFAGYAPAFRAAQPNSALTEDVARERRFVAGAQLVYCDDSARAERDILFHARHAGWHECELWAFAADERPFLFLLTPEEEAALRGAASLREVSRYPMLGAAALGLRGLLAGVHPTEIVLLANYATTDPVADKKRKREFRKERKQAIRALEEAGEAPPE